MAFHQHTPLAAPFHHTWVKALRVMRLCSRRCIRTVTQLRLAAHSCHPCQLTLPRPGPLQGLPPHSSNKLHSLATKHQADAAALMQSHLGTICAAPHQLTGPCQQEPLLQCSTARHSRAALSLWQGQGPAQAWCQVVRCWTPWGRAAWCRAATATLAAGPAALQAPLPAPGCTHTLLTSLQPMSGLLLLKL